MHPARCFLIVSGVKSRDMRLIEQEVASQPAVWRRAAELALDAPLPEHGARVAAVGCGTSLYVAQAYAVSRERSGRGETDAFAASEVPAGRRYDELLVISRSGTTTEVIDVLRTVDHMPVTAVTAVSDSPVAAAAGRTVALPFADERSVVQTRFATAVLVMLRAHLGFDTEPAAAAAERVLEADLPFDPSRFDRFVFLGRGWTIGLASEAALKLLESAQIWSDAYPAMEYRHGPIALADARTAVIPFGPIDDTLAADVRRTGALLLDPDPEPLATLVLVHRFAIALAAARGLDPDAPRNLSRSVVLP
jgi:fructoselysine-6-P-deglycase FrlB-like protein